MKKTILFFCFCFVLVTSCKDKAPEQALPELKIPYQFKLPDWAKNATIYELNTRQFSPEGNFEGISEQLGRLKEMNVDIIWLMPINPISEKKRKAKGDLLVEDIADPEERKKYFGSPYAVADYKAVNPDYGTMDDFKFLLDKAHNLGIKVIIDWVPNHTGWDNPWIVEHPEWYTQDSIGNIIDPIDYNTGKSWGWTDVADLNYDNQDMRAAMVDAMVFWLKDVGIDGFRVDVAHGIAQDFWDDTAPQLMKAKPDAFLLAESEVTSHLNNKTFHACYGWSFHHLLNAIAKGEHKAADIDKWFAEEKSKFKEGFMMHFTSNHDENTWAGTVFDRMGAAHKPLAALTCTFDGMPLLYSGMEEPMRKRLPFFTKEYIGFKDYAYSDFYQALFALKHRNRAIWNGSHGGPLVKLFEDDHVYAFTREKDGDMVHCVYNLSDKAQSFTNENSVNMMDVVNKKKVEWRAGQKIDLAPWEFYVLSNR